MASTMASTVITATTCDGESLIGVMRSSSRTSEVEEDDNGSTDIAENNSTSAPLSRDDEFNISTAEVAHHPPDHHQPRSRSQRPLTVQSAVAASLGQDYSLGPQSVASANFDQSILSTVAVAPSRSFGTRRMNAAIAAANASNSNNSEGRPLANRVVSFTTNDLNVTEEENQLAPHLENDGGGDSITMPDELDNFSDIADTFSNSARAWREEYEARLDAVLKRLGN